jgi:hypothetical protein
MAEEMTDWTFELSKVPGSALIRWHLKNGKGGILAQGVDCADITTAHSVIENIKAHAANFKIRTVPG